MIAIADELWSLPTVELANASTVSNMEFWGVEVPAGKPVPCKPGAESYLRISQAALGESKNGKGNDRVVLKVSTGKTQLVVGTLSQGRCDQIFLDLIFDKDFKLSHNSASSSVYFCGFKADAGDGSMEDVPKAVKIPVKENGTKEEKGGRDGIQAMKPLGKAVALKEALAMPKVKAKAKKEDQEEDTDEDEDEDEEDEDEYDDEMEDVSSNDDMLNSDEDDVSDEESDDEEEPKLVTKKRPLDRLNTSGTEKKIKVANTRVGELKGKKGDVKTPASATSMPKKQQTPVQSTKKGFAKETVSLKNHEGSKASILASGNKIDKLFCQPCKRNFTTKSSLAGHNIAKHS